MHAKSLEAHEASWRVALGQANWPIGREVGANPLHLQAAAYRRRRSREQAGDEEALASWRLATRSQENEKEQLFCFNFAPLFRRRRSSNKAPASTKSKG